MAQIFAVLNIFETAPISQNKTAPFFQKNKIAPFFQNAVISKITFLIN